jgi:large subunit ribosomal protein L29
MKQKEIKQLSTSDISEKIKEEAATLSKLKLSHSVSAIENPLKIRNTRKGIARLKTELKNRELSEKK